MGSPSSKSKAVAEVWPNGLVDSYLVSFSGHVVMTGLTREASQAYADELNAASRQAGAGYEAIVLPAHEPRRCPRCGSYKWIYKGDRQVCADCGRE
jgi:hypothetical protein